MTITGCMPKWQQYAQKAPLLAAAVVVFFMWQTFEAASPQHLQKNSYFALAGLVLLGLVVVGFTVRFWKRLVKEFSYDGLTLTFSTLSTPESQIRPVSTIEQISEWKGRGGSIGFRIRFDDGAKIYVQYQMPHARELAARIRSDVSAFAPDRVEALGRPGIRTVVLVAVAVAVGCLAALSTLRTLHRLPPVISLPDFLSDVDQQHVQKVVITDRHLIEGTSSTRGPFRVQTPVDDGMLQELRSRGVAIDFASSSDLTP